MAAGGVCMKRLVLRCKKTSTKRAFVHRSYYFFLLVIHSLLLVATGAYANVRANKKQQTMYAY